MPVGALHGESPSGMGLVSESEIQSQALPDSIPNTREITGFQPESCKTVRCKSEMVLIIFLVVLSVFLVSCANETLNVELVCSSLQMVI